MTSPCDTCSALGYETCCESCAAQDPGHEHAGHEHAVLDEEDYERCACGAEPCESCGGSGEGEPGHGCRPCGGEGWVR